MSYARFGLDASDVYVFMAVEGWLECCCCCCLAGRAFSCFEARATADMVDHLKAHTAAGQHVPEDVVPALLADDAENFPPAKVQP
jgi:hypothetical protein